MAEWDRAHQAKRPGLLSDEKAKRDAPHTTYLGRSLESVGGNAGTREEKKDDVVRAE